eukprot:CAMPEP_0113487620 /NCGR_PEP_ID=MMETSP0014_2-20120614/25600_1 /TAXON_ID=2857 /ORGANISM="Nitzschia sp." /LENGTH=320 /DNA_ID=CAMNT_0000381317 /DNA_START=311 /DNA_END=1273 /DNA_ORIENTATION=- /assembly_acc=CAM_ASM_000159
MSMSMSNVNLTTKNSGVLLGNLLRGNASSSACTSAVSKSTSNLTVRRFLHHGSSSSSSSSSMKKSYYSLAAASTPRMKTATTMMRSNLHKQQVLASLSSSTMFWRTLSSNANANNDSSSKEKASSDEKKKSGGGDGDGEETKEIVLTPGEQVVAATRLTMWAGIFVFACACAYYIGKELIPTKMSPNTVFNNSSKVIRDDPNVVRQYGTSLKFYGKDHGGHREGRRNFIEHTQYTNEEDGSNRTRVRFNMEGQFASAFCFVEVSSAMSSGEFVYILVQDKQTGRVITVQDNRAALTAQRLAGGNKETSDAMKQLLGGSSK